MTGWSIPLADGGRQALAAGGRLSLELPAAERETLTDRLLADAYQQARQYKMRQPVWLAADGGLISNLKAWENTVLLASLRDDRFAAALEPEVAALVALLPEPPGGWSRLFAATAAALPLPEKRLIGLLRSILAKPELMLLDGRLLRYPDFVGNYWQPLLPQLQACTLILIHDAGGETPSGWTALSWPASLPESHENAAAA